MDPIITQLHLLLRVRALRHIPRIHHKQVFMPSPNDHYPSSRLAPNILQQGTFKKFTLLVVTTTSRHLYANNRFGILLYIPQRTVPSRVLPLALCLICQNLILLAAEQGEAVYPAGFSRIAAARLCVGAPDNSVKDGLCPVWQGIPSFRGVGVVRDKRMRDNVMRG